MRSSRSQLENNIWKLHLYIGLYSLIFFTPIEVLFFQDNGLSFTQIMIIQALSSVLFIVLEVPTGHFADLYGRKTALAITGLSAAIAMFIFATGSHFTAFLVASMLWATAGVFVSGADAALLYDTLKSLGREKQYQKIWGQNSFYYYAGGALAYIIGGFMGQFDHRFTFYAIIPFMLLLVPLSISFAEPERKKPVIEGNHFTHLLRGVRISVFKKPELRWLLVYAGVIGSFVGISYYFYQPYFQLSGLDILHFGFIFAGFNLITAIGSKYAHLIEQRLGQKHSLIILFVLVGSSLLLMSHFIFLLSFSLALLIQWAKGFSNVVVTDYVNQLTASEVRATILSVKNLFEKVLFAVLSPLIGWIVDLYSLPQAMALSGLLVVIFGAISMIMLWRHRAL